KNLKKGGLVSKLIIYKECIDVTNKNVCQFQKFPYILTQNNIRLHRKFNPCRPMWYENKAHPKLTRIVGNLICKIGSQMQNCKTWRVYMAKRTNLRRCYYI
ncbi:hypothetical protein EGW08_009492, partial [Elysia chlorotica]